jgi:hypothetical protein
MAERSRRQRRGEAEKLSVFEELVNARKGEFVISFFLSKLP